MSHLFNSTVRTLLWSLGLFAAACLAAASEDTDSGQVLVKSVQGVAAYSTDQVTWLPLRPGVVLGRGAILRTEADSTADLILKHSGTALRMRPDTVLEVARLDKTIAGEEFITETSLNLKSGSIVGSQRKLHKPSTFQIALPGGVATICGTEYLVRADGAVTCLSGEVSVIYNRPRNGGSVKAEVPAGFSFDPATGQVVATTPDYLTNIIADINTVRNNAQTFKVGCATVIVKPERCVSPTCPPHDGHGGHGGGNNQPPPPGGGHGGGPGMPGGSGHNGGH